MFKWFLFEKYKPGRNGLFLVKVGNRIEVAYYDYILEQFVYFDSDYKILVTSCYLPGLYWSRMPQYSRSQLLHNGVFVLKEEFIDE